MPSALLAFTNGSVTPSKSRAASPKLTLGQEEIFNLATHIAPPPPHRITLSLPTNISEHAIKDNVEGYESDSFGTNTVTRLDHHGNYGTAIGKTEFDYGSNSRRQTGPIKAISALLVPNELSVFGPSSRIKPSHQIRQRMMTRELSGGLGPNVSWEWKEKRVTARAFEKFGRRQPEDPRTGGDGCLKDAFSDELDRDVWSQFDAMNYHARGW